MDVVERLPRSLRRALAVLAGAALFGVGVALADSAATVSLTSTGPQPATVTINWGDTVAFVNVDSVAHSLSSTVTGGAVNVPVRERPA